MSNITTINLPPSKSIAARALIINSLSGKEGQLHNLPDAEDTLVMQRALSSESTEINIGHTGTAMRFLTAYFCLQPGRFILSGSERMHQRPISILVDALTNLGARVQYLNKIGYPPLLIHGNENLKGGKLAISASTSSQYPSAVVMIAPLLKQGLEVKLEGEIVSRPYIIMTLKIMEEFGVHTAFQDNTILIPPQTYRPTSFHIENDWSSASYFYALLALSQLNEICLPGLNENSIQGDQIITEIFNELGISSNYNNKGVLLSKNEKPLPGKFCYDFTHSPDLAPTVAAFCAAAKIPFELCGLQSLRIKECDRIDALATELSKTGAKVKADIASLNCESFGPTPKNLSFNTYDDHRMAMSLSVFKLLDTGVKIQAPEVVVKSFPGFWEEFEKMNIAKSTLTS